VSVASGSSSTTTTNRPTADPCTSANQIGQVQRSIIFVPGSDPLLCDNSLDTSKYILLNDITIILYT